MINKNLLTLFFGAFIMAFDLGWAIAQEGLVPNETCLTETSEPIYQQFLEDIPRILEWKAAVPSVQRGQSNTVPVRFTVLRNDDGSFAGREVDEALVSEALARLDSFFVPLGLSFVQCGEINFVDHDNLAKFNAHRHLMDLSYVSNALNIYTRSGTGSFAQFPGNTNPNYPYSNASITSKNNSLSLASNAYLDPTFPHEVGHSYGLVHTFEGARVYNNPDEPTPGYPGGFWDHPYGGYNRNMWRREMVLRSPDSTAVFATPNAAFAGDFVEDTPAFCKLSGSYFPNWANTDCHRYPFSGHSCTGCIVYNCNYEGDYIDYNGHELQNTDVSVRNFMSYTGSCRQAFTPGQYDRMAYYHATVRSQQYDVAPCSNLRDKVSYEGTDIGMDDVLIMYEHENTYQHCNTITNTEGQFQGVLFDDEASAYVLKIGSNPNPAYDDNPNDYLVPPTKVILENSYTAEDWTQGLTVKDALMLHQHLMGEAVLDGYKQIAADLDRDGNLTFQDSGIMLSLLAGNLNKLSAYQSPWRFMPEYIPQLYSEDFHADPFNMTIDNQAYEQSAPFLEAGWALNISDGLSGKNGFDGIKLGDLDGSSIPGAGTLAAFRTCSEEQSELLYANFALAAGQLVEVAVALSTAAEIAACQLGMRLNSDLIELDSILPGDLPGFSASHNIGYSSNKPEELSLAWASDDARPKLLEPGAALFRLALKVKKALPNLQEVLELDTTLLKTMILNGQGCSLPQKLEIMASSTEVEKEGGVAPQVQRLICHPNPALSNLFLSFLSQTGGKAMVIVHDALGQMIKKRSFPLQPGWNNARQELSRMSPGVYFLALHTPDGVFTQKFFKTE